jgi:hypothetical protein
VPDVKPPFRHIPYPTGTKVKGFAFGI